MPRIETVLFDMDGVLSRYDFARRLEVLALGTGVPAAEINERIFASGFDARADDGAYSAAGYMTEFSRLLDVEVSVSLWLEARAAGMSVDLDMLDLVQEVSRRVGVAMLTNNGPVLREHLAEVVPAITETFGDRAFFSCQFGTGKTSPEVFGLVLTAIGAAPETTLFIDDTDEYVENGRRAGLRTHRFEGELALRRELARLSVL